MNFEQFELPIRCTLDPKTTQIWWLAYLEYMHSKLWLLCYCFALDVFVPTSAHPLLLFLTNGLSKYTQMPI